MWVGVDPSRIGMPCHEHFRYASRCYGINSNRDNNLVNYPRMLVLFKPSERSNTFLSKIRSELLQVNDIN